MEEQIKKLKEIIVRLEKIIETYNLLVELMAKEIDQYQNMCAELVMRGKK